MCYLHHLEKLLTAENPGANIRLSYYPHPHYVEQHGYTARVLDFVSHLRHMAAR